MRVRIAQVKIRATAPTAWLLCVTVALGGLLGCDPEPGTGACNGNEPGGYFDLTVVNYTNESYEIRMNDRLVGSVSSYSPGLPATVSLKEFPTCDAHVLEARALDNSALRFCSNEGFVTCAGAPSTSCQPSGTVIGGCCGLAIRLCAQLAGDNCTASDNQVFTSADIPQQATPACACDVTATWPPC